MRATAAVAVYFHSDWSAFCSPGELTMSPLSTMVRAGALLVLAMASGAAGSPARGAGQRGTHPPSVPDQYAFLYASPAERSAAWAAARQSLPFESISLKRMGCFGTCPVYTVTLRLDGSASYDGARFVERLGNFSGQVYFGDFAQLSLFVERSGHMKLADRYAAPWTDDETVQVTVTPRTGAPKTVTDYGRYGPPDLWMLERSIDGVAGHIKWTSVAAGQGKR
jgi:hypothetical protein